jgi:glucose-1-phosphate cytidylyltransferase
MKVVLFCGGLGMRLREYSETIPKPMVKIGNQPMLWYLMKYYASFGHTDFILCLGYRGDVIKRFFLDYSEYMSNDFTMSNGGVEKEIYHTDIHDWTITFADTGQHANIGQRLKAVERYIGDDEMFLANYADGLTDLPLDRYLEFFLGQNKTASFVAVRPRHTFHIVNMDDQALVKDVSHVEKSVWINGGYFIFKREILDHIKPGEELVDEPFRRLMDQKQLLGYKYDGFWECMDTFKDKQQFDEMYARGYTPWMVWDKESKGGR